MSEKYDGFPYADPATPGNFANKRTVDLPEFAWRCSGCDSPSPDQVRSCDCPTDALYKLTPTGIVHAAKLPSFGKVESIPAHVGEDIARHLEAIQGWFTNSKVTFIARAVGYDDGSRDMVMTDDDLGAVIRALEIRKAVA